MEVIFAPSFLKALEKYPDELKAETYLKVKLFRSEPQPAGLKIHKLNGKFKDFYAFSVNYRIRIIFQYEGSPRLANFLDINDHDHGYR